ncbi:membrane-associated proteins in eicosanoid and glutathione metabolism [Colletotrichum sojae]|uniref:Membrane-associated proteins in eicosanoid and glutathione metabolism n=1 Tax=Colletotrichum sojae TaxID=2175907 RepID=A0A8H6IY77_9PEZI|nr:membrane-associated proteins in eicosanoid and glutathione metabolism [Colletotrichum sojae]
MSPNVIGLPTLPKLLPVTGAFALPFTAYYILLSLRVVKERIREKRYLGDGSSGGPDRQSYQNDKLFLATRAHGNFLENVHLVFIVASLIELNGGSRKVLGWMLGGVLTSRVLHADLGLLMRGSGYGGPVGYYANLGLLGVMAGYGAYLVKGYWGF